jgi:hypothetical protein
VAIGRAGLVLAVALGGCGPREGAPARPIRLLHTFSPGETGLANAALAQRGLIVDASLVPFARGQQVIGEILRAGRDCPALIRVDATWLPELVAEGLVSPPPAALTALDWLPEAASLARGEDGRWWALPQTVDGLVVIRRATTPAPADDSLAALLASAQAARANVRWPLGLRADGYWLVPWLRARGAELAPTPPAADAADPAEDALAGFAALFGSMAPPLPPPGGEAPDELAAWRAGEVAYWVTGPWQLGELEPTSRDALVVGSLRHAPRGGQLLVVPRCASDPDAGWRVAQALTEVPVQLAFAVAFASVPTRRAALDAAPALVGAVHAALATAEPLPRTPLTPRLFDDLNPALAAVVHGEATAGEAMAGVRRGWRRLARRPVAPSPRTP